MLSRRKGSEEKQIRTLGEDLLKAVAHGRWIDEAWRAEDVMPVEAGALKDEVLEYLLANGKVDREGGRWRLTQKGHDRALELLRAHRLVETYLARKEGRPAGSLHAEADRAEHEFTTEGINALADSLNRPRYDPHGDPIPERAQDLIEPRGMLLADTPAPMEVRIVHMEDEPQEDFEKLSELGLALELAIRVTGQTGSVTQLELAGETLDLSARLATHIEVRPLEAGERFREDLSRLSFLKPGERGIVEFISPACLGPERHRLLDFGMVPGSEVYCEYTSPFGSPIAYSLRGSTIGLRRAQARNIFIRKV